MSHPSTPTLRTAYLIIFLGTLSNSLSRSTNPKNISCLSIVNFLSICLQQLPHQWFSLHETKLNIIYLCLLKPASTTQNIMPSTRNFVVNPYTYSSIVHRDCFEVVLKVMPPVLIWFQLVHLQQLVCKYMHHDLYAKDETFTAKKIKIKRKFI